MTIGGSERLIHLKSIDSTNRYLSDLKNNTELEEWTVVYADYQENGRGQRGNVWESESGLNLLCSVYVKNLGVQSDCAFLINEWVSLSLFEVLEEFGVRNLKIKWPNDILIGNKKVCGVLVENGISGKLVSESVLGIGLNLNQIDVLETATSIINETGEKSDIKTVLNKVVDRLKYNNGFLKSKRELLRVGYLNNLYGYDESVMVSVGEIQSLGRVVGLLPNGIIQIEVNGTVKQFDFKEVSWVGISS
jgi:BirA family biotin operon repressor/biotin-[acetyl-CoA-carboxylase] ligase